MASTIKVNNIQNQCGANIVNKCSTTITLGASGDTITLACGASQTGFGRTGTVDWDTTAKTASFTAVSGNGYFVNTTSGAITVTLPASPSAGDIVAVKDYAGTFNTNNCTVGRNSSNINGDASDFVIYQNSSSLVFVYVDATQGWSTTSVSVDTTVGSDYIVATGGTETTCGNFKIHTFTGPGTFTVSSAGTSAGSNTVSYLVVAGGAGGGANRAGGGGAGGYREGLGLNDCYTGSPLRNSSGVPVAVQAYPITVGAGGAASSSPSPVNGTDGSNSVFSTITSAGGGGGGSYGNPAGTDGNNGGSGGGGGAAECGSSSTSGGLGNTPPVSPAQGNNGGNVTPTGTGGGPAGAGGGGATVTGGNTTTNSLSGGTGGNGATTSISASPTSYAGGGGGGANGPANASGGTGGGGPGGRSSPICGTDGTANTGGGGGGSGNGAFGGGDGGSGIVIIRYKYQ